MKHLATLLLLFLCLSRAHAQIPIVYYDCENNTTRTNEDVAVEMSINTTPTGSNITITGTTGANAAIGSVSNVGAGLTLHSGAAAGSAVSCSGWSTVAADPTTGAASYYSFNVNTSGFNGITLTFDEKPNNINSPYYGVLMSTNGTTWTLVGSVGTTNGNTIPWSNANWATASFSLPAAANNLSTLYLRIYGYNAGGAGNGAFLAIDNVTVLASSTVAGKTFTTMNESQYYTEYTSGLTGGLVTRGSFTATGASTNVTINSTSGLAMTSGQTFAVAAGATLTFGSSGAISGTGGIVTTASGTNVVVANTGGMPAAITASSASSNYGAGTNYSFNAATTAPFPTVGTLGNPANVTINPGAGSSVTLNVSPTITGALTFTTGKLALSNKTLTLNGTVTGMSASNPITGGASAVLSVTGTGTLGTLFFDQATPGTSNLLSSFTVNRTSSGLVTLGNNVNVGSGGLALTAGTLADGGNTISLAGSITGTGTHSGTGKIAMTGSGGAISAVSLGNLELNNSGGFSLSGSPTINGTLTLTSGRLTLGANDLILSATTPAIAGTLSSANMIVTNGAGQLRKMLGATGNYLFPVGDNTPIYSPITVDITSGTIGGGAYVSVKTTKLKHPNNANLSNYLNRYWNISTSSITSPAYTASAVYVTGDVSGTEANIAAANYTGTLPWSRFGLTNTGTHTLTTGTINNVNAEVTGISNINPTVSSTANGTMCLGGTKSLAASSAVGDPTLSYSWAPSTGLSATAGASVSTTPVAIGNITYTLTITDGNGFTGTANTTVSVVAAPAAAPTASGPICNGGTVNLTANPSSGANSFTWSGSSLSSASSQDPTATPASTTVYSLTVSDGSGNPGCSPATVYTTSVTVNAAPTLSSASSNTPVCEGSQLDLTANSPANVTGYAWTGPVTITNAATAAASVPSVGSSAAGIYTVTINNGSGSGCTATYTTSVAVNPKPAVVTVTGGGTYCANATLLASNGSDGTIYFQGSSSGGTSTSTPSTSALVTSSNTWYFRARSAAGCWGDQGGAAVTINPLPATVAVSGGGTYCGNTTVTASNGSDGTIYFQGTTSGGTSTTTPSASEVITSSGTYYFRARSAAGCWGAEGSVAVTINPLPATTVASGDGIFCQQTTITATNGNDGTMYFQGIISGGTSTATPSASQIVNTTGVYYFRAQSSLGCWGPQGSVAVTVNPLPAAVTASGAGTFCGSATITADNGGDGTIYFQGTTTDGLSLLTPSTSEVVGSSGTYYFRAFSAAGCWGPEGSVTVTVNHIPSIVSTGGAGVHCGSATITADNGSDGTIYFQGLTSGGTSILTPSASETVTSSGTYYFRALSPEGCWGPEGSVTVIINPLPADVTVTGGGTFCGSTTLTASNGSDGTMYFQGMTTTGTSTSIASTSEVVNASGTYYFRARSSDGCWSNQGSAAVTVNVIPAVVTVSGAGTYCGSGTITAANGNDGTIYYQGTTALGTSVLTPSVSEVISATGTYYFRALSSEGCWGPQGSAVVSVNPLPAAVTVSGAGTYCGSATLTAANGGDGTIYYQGLTTGGTSVATAATSQVVSASGTYYFRARSAAGCWGAEGSTSVTVNPLPDVTNFSVTSTSPCLGFDASVTLNSSSLTSGNYTVTYNLSGANSSIANTVSATLSSGTTSITVPASLLASSGATVLAVTAVTNTNTCTSNISTGNAASFNVNPLPATVTVSGGGVYCNSATITAANGGDGTIYYQGITSGGLSIATPSTSEVVTDTGVYYFRARSALGCWGVQGSTAVTVNPLPAVHSVTGGGHYCAGGAGVTISLDGSNGGILYQLYDGSGPVGGLVSGTGGGISMGVYTTAGTYTAVATNLTTACMSDMSDSAVVIIDTLPANHTVSGGGSYCAGGVGVDVAMDGSEPGINYQLYNNVSTSVGPVKPGTGTGIDFGNQVLGGAFIVIATDGITGCQKQMTGTPTVTVNPLPPIHTVVGGGSYCSGSIGRTVSINGSDAGIRYQLFNGASTVGGMVDGTTFPITFGTYTTAGTYSVLATDATTGCIKPMPGAPVIIINPLPEIHAVTGGGSYCAGGVGVDVGVDVTQDGIRYQLYSGASTVGTPVNGAAAAPVSLGLQTMAATYTVLATDTLTGCTSNMTGSATVTINPLLYTGIDIGLSTPTSTVCSGSPVTFSTTTVHPGTAPAYQWYINSVPVAGATSSSYLTTTLVNNDTVSVLLTSNALCATPVQISDKVRMTVITSHMPSVVVAPAPGDTVCGGTLVNYVPTPSFGGSAPQYLWYRNGSQVATGPSYTYIPLDGDVVYAKLLSNLVCRLADTVSGNMVNMVVRPVNVPVVMLELKPGDYIKKGKRDTVQATVTHGGALPTYKWFLNSVEIAGVTNSRYISDTFRNNDVVTCRVMGDGPCAEESFNTVTVHVKPVGVEIITAEIGDVVLAPNPNKGTFSIHGSLSAADGQEVLVQLVDLIGNTIYNKTAVVHNNAIDEEVSLDNNLPNGMYMLDIRCAEDHKVLRMMLAR